MEFLTDPVLLARIQFALTAMYHYGSRPYCGDFRDQVLSIPKR